MATTNISGTLGKVTIDVTTDACITGWSAEPVYAYEDTTNTCGSGYEEQIKTVTSLTGQFTWNWDTAQKPFDTPSVAPGEQVALLLYVGDPADNVKLAVPKADITSTPITSEVKGIVSVTVNFKAFGTFTLPN